MVINEKMPKKKTDHNVEEPAFEYEARHTYADYLKAGADVVYETIRGKIMKKMAPGAGSSHQRSHRQLFGALFNVFQGKSCELFSAPFDVILPVQNETKGTATTIVQPDILVSCNAEIIEERGCFGPPDLIVEIVSPSHGGVKRDLEYKYSIYEEAGVKEYWIVFPNLKIIEVYLLEDGKYQQAGRYVEDAVFGSPTLPAIEIDLKTIFKN